MHHLWKRSATKSTKFTKSFKAQSFHRRNSRIQGIYTSKKEICRQPFGAFINIWTEYSSGFTLAPTIAITYTATSSPSSPPPPQRNTRLNDLSYRTHQLQLDIHEEKILRRKQIRDELKLERNNTNQSYHHKQL